MRAERTRELYKNLIKKRNESGYLGLEVSQRKTHAVSREKFLEKFGVAYGVLTVASLNFAFCVKSSKPLRRGSVRLFSQREIDSRIRVMSGVEERLGAVRIDL